MSNLCVLSLYTGNYPKDYFDKTAFCFVFFKLTFWYFIFYFWSKYWVAGKVNYYIFSTKSKFVLINCIAHYITITVHSFFCTSHTLFFFFHLWVVSKFSVMLWHHTQSNLKCRTGFKQQMQSESCQTQSTHDLIGWFMHLAWFRFLGWFSLLQESAGCVLSWFQFSDFSLISHSGISSSSTVCYCKAAVAPSAVSVCMWMFVCITTCSCLVCIMCCTSVSVGMIRCMFVCTLYTNLCYAFVFTQCACVGMSY